MNFQIVQKIGQIHFGSLGRSVVLRNHHTEGKKGTEGKIEFGYKSGFGLVFGKQIFEASEAGKLKVHSARVVSPKVQRRMKVSYEHQVFAGERLSTRGKPSKRQTLLEPLILIFYLLSNAYV